MISTRRQEWRRATWPATSVAAAFHALIVSLACHGTTYAAEQAPVTLALVGGRIIDGFGGAPLENGVVLIAGNRIARVGSEASVAVPEGVRRIDVDGMSVLPGLWESHGHLMHIGEGDPDRFPSDFAAQAHDIMAAAARTNLLSGITTFRDTGGPLDEQMKLRAEINSGSLPGPRLFLAGPILRQIQPAPDRGSSREPKNPDWVATPEEARAAVRRLIARGVDQVKVYGFWDLPILQAVTSTAHAAGLGVDADVRHIVAYRTAVEAGVDRLHHVFTADPLSGYSEEDFRLLVRGVKPVGAGPMANILRGPWILPTIEMRQSYARAQSFPELIDHPRFKEQYPPMIYEHLRSSWASIASIPWGIGAAQRVDAAKRKLRHFIEAGGREQLVAGTDAGSPLNVHSPLTREIRNLLESGLTPMEAIQSATLRPAQMQGVSNDLGTITAGKFADLVVVDGDPLQDISLLERGIVLVVKDGRLYEPPRRSLMQ